MSDLEALDTLIGGYLNEDWYLEYGDPWLAIERFVLWEPDYAPSVRADVVTVLDQCRSDAELEIIMDKLGLGYAVTTAGWESYRAWLLAVADRVDAILRKSSVA